jgi:hypothetical protein
VFEGWTVVAIVTEELGSELFEGKKVNSPFLLLTFQSGLKSML